MTDLKKADRYNAKREDKGYLSQREKTLLVHYFQVAEGLSADGMYGPKTEKALQKLYAEEARTKLDLCQPMRRLSDGRKPVITSRHGSVNPDRPRHNGDDWFYQFKKGDVIASNSHVYWWRGKPRWWIPFGATADACADGEILYVDLIKTGWQVWVGHEEAGIMFGYRHGEKPLVEKGQLVKKGDPVIVVGESPVDRRGKRHLHHMVSPIERYAPFDPQKLLEGAPFLEAVA